MQLPSTETLLRQFRSELADVSGEWVSGLFAVTDTRADVGPFREAILPGAFAGALTDTKNIGMLWSHDPNSPMAKSPRTLRLGESRQGLVAVGVVAPESYISSMVLGELARGVVSGGSIGFSVSDDDNFWVLDDDNVPLRLIEKVTWLFEVSPCCWPAYTTTSVWSSVSAEQQREAIQRDIDSLKLRIVA